MSKGNMNICKECFKEFTTHIVYEYSGAHTKQTMHTDICELCYYKDNPVALQLMTKMKERIDK